MGNSSRQQPGLLPHALAPCCETRPAAAWGPCRLLILRGRGGVLLSAPCSVRGTMGGLFCARETAWASARFQNLRFLKSHPRCAQRGFGCEVGTCDWHYSRAQTRLSLIIPSKTRSVCSPCALHKRTQSRTPAGWAVGKARKALRPGAAVGLEVRWFPPGCGKLRLESPLSTRQKRLLAPNLALPYQQPAAGGEATRGFSSLILCLDPPGRAFCRSVPRALRLEAGVSGIFWWKKRFNWKNSCVALVCFQLASCLPL